MTMYQVKKAANNFAAGIAKLGLITTMEAEGKKWRFLGIQSKNRKEWAIIHLSNMYNNTTTIALYDTLGVGASRYILDQTQL